MSDSHPHPHPAPGHEHPPGHVPTPGGSPAPATEAKPPEAPPAEAEENRTQALAEALRSSFVIVKAAMVILAAAFVCSGVFKVEPQERAIRLQFGKPVGEGESALLGPGLHWAFPYPIDEVKKVPALQIQQAVSTVGWYATDPRLEALGQEPPAGPSLNPAVDGYTLTGDGNIIHVRATLRYRVVDPVKYHFHFLNAAEFVTNALNNAILFASAQYTVDNALRRDLAGFKERVLFRVKQLIRDQDLGIAIEPSDLVVIPPRQVKASFEEVLAAESERSKAINDAQGYANEVLSKASGEAQALINAGQTERTRLVASVQAEAQYFTSILPEYLKNRTLYLSRLQTETLARVMTNAQDKFFLSARADGRPRELRLLLGREPLKIKGPEAAKPDGHGH